MIDFSIIEGRVIFNVDFFLVLSGGCYKNQLFLVNLNIDVMMLCDDEKKRYGGVCQGVWVECEI